MESLYRGSEVSRAIKKILKTVYPNTKFSVRYSSGSMTDSVNISWNFGATSQQITDITDRFQEGNFDGMTDSYNYKEQEILVTKRGELRKLGGVQYVFESRDFKMPNDETYGTPSIKIEIAKELAKRGGIEWEGDQTKISVGGNITAIEAASILLRANEFDTSNVFSYDGLMEANPPKGWSSSKFGYSHDEISKESTIGEYYPEIEERYEIKYNGDKVSRNRKLIRSLEKLEESFYKQQEEDQKRQEQEKAHKAMMSELMDKYQNTSLSETERTEAYIKMVESDYSFASDELKDLHFSRYKVSPPVMIEAYSVGYKHTNLSDYKKDLEQDKKDGDEISKISTKILQVIAVDQKGYAVLSNTLMDNAPDVWDGVGGTTVDDEDIVLAGYDIEEFEKKLSTYNFTPQEKEFWFDKSYSLGTLVWKKDSKECFVVDVQGYGYARYVYLPVDFNQCEKALLRIKEDETGVESKVEKKTTSKKDKKPPKGVDKSEIQSAIDGLKELLKLSNKKESKKIQEAIDGLEVLLKS